jgi:hypothetical protein
MPIKPGKSKKVVSENISELMTSKPSKTRQKGIDTLAKKRGISKRKAQQIQAVAIAKSSARKSSKKSKKRTAKKK